jgi:ureidoglycolate dehydrogenase (NAD+)
VTGRPSLPATYEPIGSLPVESLRQFCFDALIRTELAESDATIAVDALCTTDCWGVFTHGIKALRGYLRRLYGGGLDPHGRPNIVAEGGGWATVDGDSSLGMVTSAFAMRTAIDKARKTGIGYVGVRNSCHFGAAGYYAWLAAQAGFIGLSMANDIPSVSAPGSRGAIIGSNPLAYAIPAGRHRPMILDMSIATVAGGKVAAANERGEPIPLSWLIDADGRPTDDASSYPGSSTLTPAAGHKGYGIGLLIEAMSGVLSGAATTWRVGSWMTSDSHLPTHHGAAFLAIDCAAIAGGHAFGSHMDRLIDEIHGASTADGVERIYVPGEIEWEKYDAAVRSGVSFPTDVIASMREAADMSGLRLESYFS